jgi:hypothetical protein
MQFAAVREGLVFEDSDGAHERGALLSLARAELVVFGPACELAVGGELKAWTSSPERRSAVGLRAMAASRSGLGETSSP